MIMKKKDYQKPTIQVVTLQHQTQLLYTSLNAERPSYGTASVENGTEQEWD